MNWSILKQLKEIYETGKTDKNFIKTTTGKRLCENEYLTEPVKSAIFKKEGYNKIFESKYLTDYNLALSIINKFSLYNTNFEISKLKSLKLIHENKKQIVDNLTLKEIASEYFGGSKTVTKDTKLYHAILNVLETDNLPEDEHDQQYLTVLHCKNKVPKKILICENKNLLKKKRFDNIELWYAGGKNINKLHFIQEPKIPLYYICDWDNDGIEIYYRIKQLFKNIELIIPQEQIKLKPTANHIKWKIEIKDDLLSKEAIILLKSLVNNKKWIEEETIKFYLEEKEK